MSRGELLQQDLADLDLVAYGAMIAAAVVVSLSGHKECGEDQGCDQQRRSTDGGKTHSFCQVLLPPLYDILMDRAGTDTCRAGWDWR